MQNLQTEPDARMTLAPSGANRIRITELATRLGTTPRAIRYYEELALITPHRTRTGARTYCADIRRTLEIIVALRRAGAPIDDIRSILAEPTDGENLTQKVSGALRVRLRDLQGQMDDLKSLLSQLSAVNLIEPSVTLDAPQPSCDSLTPSLMRSRSEQFHAGSGGEMPLRVEGVVNGGMSGQKPLR